MLASYINPPLATVNTAIPLWNSVPAVVVVASCLPPLAPADVPVVVAAAEAWAPNSKLPLVNSSKARWSSKKMIWL
jgi:hypothetical protein